MSDDVEQQDLTLEELVTRVIGGCTDYGIDYSIEDAPTESFNFFRGNTLRIIDKFIETGDKRIVGFHDNLFGRLFWDVRPIWDLKKGNGIKIFYSMDTAPWKSIEIFHTGDVR